MAVNFPDSPSLNQEFTSGTRTWIWNGSVWLLKATLNIAVANLNDVTLTDLANGDALVYNSTTQEWVNGEVDLQGAIETANEYTDQAVEDLTDYIDGFLDQSTGTTIEYIDEQDAATLAAANEYTDNALDGFESLPAQSGNSGKYLTTNGTTASWATLDAASTTVSENAPTGPSVGDTWFRSSTGQYFVYYDSFWVEVGAGSSTLPAQYLYGLTYGSSTGNLIIEYNIIDSSQPAVAVSDYNDWFMTSHVQSNALEFSIVDGHLIMESA